MTSFVNSILSEIQEREKKKYIKILQYNSPRNAQNIQTFFQAFFEVSNIQTQNRHIFITV